MSITTTVGKLVEILSKFDQSLPVVLGDEVNDRVWDLSRISPAIISDYEIDNLYLSPEDTKCLVLSTFSPRDPDWEMKEWIVKEGYKRPPGTDWVPLLIQEDE